MIVKIEPNEDSENPDPFKIVIQQGVQSFELKYTGNWNACEWYAKMFRHALAKHDEEMKVISEQSK